MQFTPTVFQDFDSILGGAVQVGTGKLVAKVLAGVAADTTALIALLIMIRGVLISFRQHDYWKGIVDILRMFAVSMLIGGGWYVTYFQTPILTTIPNWIASITTDGAAGPNAQGRQFDLIFSADLHILSSVLQGVSASPHWVAQALIAFWATLATGFFLAVVFAVWEVTKVLSGLVIIGGAFLIGFLLYNATRPVFFRFIDKLIGLMLLDAMMASLIQFILYANGTYVKKVQDINAGIDTQVMILVVTCMFAMMSAAIATIVPAVAARIGGGVGVDSRQIVNMAKRQAQRMAAYATRGARAAAGGGGAKVAVRGRR
jgi:hypothetical protein